MEEGGAVCNEEEAKTRRPKAESGWCRLIYSMTVWLVRPELSLRQKLLVGRTVTRHHHGTSTEEPEDCRAFGEKKRGDASHAASRHRSFPDGKVKVLCIGAGGLRAADTHVFKKASSDPYMRFWLVNTHPDNAAYQTKTIEKTCDPRWHQEFSVDVHKLPSGALPTIFFEVWDEDVGEEDDFLGEMKVDLAEVGIARYPNVWRDLTVKLASNKEKGKYHASGAVRLRLRWEPDGLSSTHSLSSILRGHAKQSYSCQVTSYRSEMMAKTTYF